MRGLFGRDSLYVLIWGLQVGVAALSVPITTRLLGRNFGVVTTAFAVMQILVPLCSSACQRRFSVPIELTTGPATRAERSR
jgi:hypothetical protein